MFKRRMFFKEISLAIAIIMVMELLVPIAANAITSGPAQPEYASFTPVGTSGMVNEFDGSFSYSIPLMTVPGPNGSSYPITLAYNSGAKPGDQASWVGFGWSLNTGAIVRNKRGYPDDYKGEEVITRNKTVRNETNVLTNTVVLFPEIFSISDLPSGTASLNAFSSSIFNNYTGQSNTFGTGLTMSDYGSLGYDLQDEGSMEYSYNVNFFKSMNILDTYVGGIFSDINTGITDLETELSILGSINSNFYNPLNSNSYFRSENHLRKELSNNETEYKTGSVTSMKLGFVLDAFGNWGQRLPEPRWTFSEQETEPIVTDDAYGYMYSGEAEHNEEVLMDYYLEKKTNFNDRDRFLPIPFSNYDVFNITGAGIGGGFRCYNATTGHFGPKTVESKKDVFDGEIQLHYGYESIPLTYVKYVIGVGPGAKGGKINTKISKWKPDKISKKFDFAELDDYYRPYERPIFFKFFNDPGGSNSYYSDEVSPEVQHSPVQATIKNSGLQSNMSPLVDSTAYYKINGRKQSRASTNIGYVLLKDLSSEQSNKLHSKDLTIDQGFYENLIDENGLSVCEDHIGQFYVVNQQGVKYVYGLPVYNRNEKQISYGFKKLSKGSVEDNLKVYQSMTIESENYGDSPDVIIGREMNSPYAGTYLLTLITTPDYVDLTGDGPSDDDLGGYTKFSYEKSTDEDWYKWREPYNGLSYSRNSFSCPDDDMGSYASGEKEIYYLKSVETKTHIAYFINNYSDFHLKKKNVNQLDAFGNQTDNSFIEDYNVVGSKIDRKDAYEACHDEAIATTKSDYNDVINENFGRPKKLRRLERIELYKKGDVIPENEREYIVSEGPLITVEREPYEVDELIKTVNFSYDESYPLWSGLPNTVDHAGKLTLKKIWFEYNGIRDERIQPYIFDYDYAQIDLPTKYDRFESYQNLEKMTEIGYDPANIDAWGNYQQNGTERYKKYDKSINQFPDATFDPAAGNLKMIRLPSGGLINVFYEQNDYSTVQNRDAMKLIPLCSKENQECNHTTFYIDPDDLFDGSYSISDIDEYIEKCKSIFQSNEKHIYFKFLYSFFGDENDDYLDYCAAEVLEGFEMIQSDHNGITRANVGGKELIKFIFQEPQAMELCEKFYHANRRGLIENFENSKCNLSEPSAFKGNGKFYFNMIEASKANSPDDILSTFADVLVSQIENASLCESFDQRHSYLRLPLPQAKKGGGIRVKAILTIDNFNQEAEMSTEDLSVYGTEYLYKNSDGSSSGVATNEPDAIFEENPFYDYLIGLSGELEKGEDTDLAQFSGPLGKSIMPAPTIQYSRVISKNIHEDPITGTGYQIKEYYTEKDFPWDHQFELVEKSGENFSFVDNTEIEIDRNFPISISTEKALEQTTSSYDVDLLEITKREYTVGLGVSYANKKSKSTQGYQFISDRMNGKPKIFKTCIGTIENGENYSEKIKKIAWEEYEYYDPWEKIPVMYDFNEVGEEYLGRDMEIIYESRKVEEEEFKFGGDGDYSVTTITIPATPVTPPITIIIPAFSFYPNAEYSNDEKGTHVTNKIISYPGYLKKKTSYAEDITSVVENVYFDPYTGQPVVQRAYDAYNDQSYGQQHNGVYNSYNIFASHIYDGMNQKFLNEQKRYIHTYFNDQVAWFYTWQDEYSDQVQQYGIIRIIDRDANDEITNCRIEFDFEDFSKVDACAVVRDFSPGDLIKVSIADGDPDDGIDTRSSYNGYWEVYRVVGVDCYSLQLTPLFLNYPSDYHIENSLNIGEIVSEEGEFLDAHECDIEVIESGRSNQLNARVGDLVTYGTDDLAFFDAPRLVSNPGNFDLETPNEYMYVGEIRRDESSREIFEQKAILAETLSNWVNGLIPKLDEIKKINGAFTYDPGYGWYLENPPELYPNATPTNLIYVKNKNCECVPFSDFDIEATVYVNKMYHWHQWDKDEDGWCDCPPDPEDAMPYWQWKGYNIGTGITRLAQTACSDFSTNPSDNYEPDGWSHCDSIIPPSINIDFKIINKNDADDVCEMEYRFCPNVEDVVFTRGHYGDEMHFFFNKKGQLEVDYGNIYQVETYPGSEVYVEYFNNCAGWGTSKCEWFGCLEFCDNMDYSFRAPNVIKHNAVTFTDQWDYSRDTYLDVDISSMTQEEIDAHNERLTDRYFTGEKGNWKVKDSYANKEEIKSAKTGNAVYESGTMINNSFTDAPENTALFNWNFQDNNDKAKWLKTSEVNEYSKEGYALEDQSMMGIKSTASFTKDGLPEIITSNSSIGNSGFESFEHNESGLINGIIINNEQAHTGSCFKELEIQNSASDEFITKKYRLTEEEYKKYDVNDPPKDNLHIKFWFKINLKSEQQGAITDLPSNISSLFNLEHCSKIGTSAVSKDQVAGIKLLAQSGDWYLCEVEFQRETTGSAFTGVDYAECWFEMEKTVSNEVYIDDFRFSPRRSSSQCYVYDRINLKPMAILNDDHFAMIYQYDLEGQLKRIRKETYRGTKTVSESNMHIVSIGRSNNNPMSISDAATDPLGITQIPGSYYPPGANIENFENQQSDAIKEKFDMMNLEISPDKTKVDVLGIDPSKLRKAVDSIGNYQKPILKIEDLPQFPDSLNIRTPENNMIDLDSISNKVHMDSSKIFQNLHDLKRKHSNQKVKINKTK
jgi:hypothetical protein